MIHRAVLTLPVIGASVISLAGVPTYRVDLVDSFASTTTVRGASDEGHIVGDQVENGLLTPFVATLDAGLTALPLPPGYQTGSALDANDSGVVVGTVSTSTFPFDTGEPAVWTPDGDGGYVVDIPQQFGSLPSPLGGSLTITGGQAVAINDNGLIVGWSRFQGFGGGPATRFSTDGPPVDLRDFGFDATPTDLSDSGIVVGAQLRLDLGSGEVTDIGVPDPVQPGNVSFTNSIAFSVNDSGETVVAANLASIPTENWLTYIHNDSQGYTRLNADQAPSRFVGFYDNNNGGDVSASGGVLFRDEGVLVEGYASLLEPGSTNWTVNLGFIADDRRVFTTAVDPGANVNAIVVLTPVGEQPVGDLDGDGSVGSGDLSILLGTWGPCPAQGACPADLNGDGAVGSADLAILLGAWG